MHTHGAIDPRSPTLGGWTFTTSSLHSRPLTDAAFAKHIIPVGDIVPVGYPYGTRRRSRGCLHRGDLFLEICTL